MNDDSIKGLSEAELAKHIAELESQPWLGALRELKPNANTDAVYALGFAAGRQAQAQEQTNALEQTQAPRPFAASSNWQLPAAVSSVISMAATVLIMLQLSPSLVRSSSQRSEVVQRAPLNLNQPIAASAGTTDTETIDIEELLAQLHRSSTAMALPKTGSIDSSEPALATESLRYVTQRQRLISELAVESAN